MSSIKERYISNTPLKDRPRHPIKLSLKDNCVTTKKLADKAVTTEKLANKSVTWEKLSVDFLEEALNKLKKGLIVPCTVFSLNGEGSEDINRGVIDTYIFDTNKLYYKSGVRIVTQGDRKVTQGVYEEVPLSTKDVYVDKTNNTAYIWDGSNMICISAVRITENELDQIINI